MYASREETLGQIIGIISEYGGQPLTIRQIYYRLVADRGLENSLNSYKRVVDITAKARLSGELPYESIEDRSREISENDKIYSTVGSHMNWLHDVIRTWPERYKLPLWHGQRSRVVMMVEKQALQGIFLDVCEKWEVDLMVCKGYPSLTQQWELSNRIREMIDGEQSLQMIYFGDFDPSGENIPEKLEERLSQDFGVSFDSFTKEALTIDQVYDMALPPAPAKRTDSRTKGFVEKYGVGMQVELDAIKPDSLRGMIDASIRRHFDFRIKDKAEEAQKISRDRIRNLIGQLGDVSCLISDDEGES